VACKTFQQAPGGLFLFFQWNAPGYFCDRVYAVVDIETTGSRFGEDRITEVAVYLTDGETITGEWSSLVNPGVDIPPFITNLTGIDNDLVADAPSFADLAETIASWTDDKIFVAHNAAFDYHFLRREFERIGQVFQRRRLCTVQVSRKIFPGLPSYSLGKLCDRLGIPISDRHRAHGDARATALLLSMLVDNDRRGVLAKTLKHGSGERNLPPNVPQARFLALPERTGVYYFHNEKGQVIYVGKARNIRSRVASHFAAAERHPTEARMRHLVYDLSFEETGSELVALLLESIEIKRHQPIFNAAQKQWQANYGLIHYLDQKGYQRLGVLKTNSRQPALLTFPDMLSARNFLQRKCSDFNLCPRLCSLQTVTGPCYDRRAGACDGACEEAELPELYNQRAAAALASFGAEFGNLMIIGRGRQPEERSVIAVENGHYLGFGYFAPELTGEDPALIRSCVKHQPDNPDVQRILQTYLRSSHRDRVLEYAAE